MIRELEQLSCGDRLRKMGLSSLGKRKLQRDLTVAFQHLKGAWKQLFTRTCSDNTRGNDFRSFKRR